LKVKAKASPKNPYETIYVRAAKYHVQRYT